MFKNNVKLYIKCDVLIGKIILLTLLLVALFLWLFERRRRKQYQRFVEQAIMNWL